MKENEPRTELEIDYILAVYYYRLLTLEEAQIGLEKGITPIELWRQKGTGEIAREQD